MSTGLRISQEGLGIIRGQGVNGDGWNRGVKGHVTGVSSLDHQITWVACGIINLEGDARVVGQSELMLVLPAIPFPWLSIFSKSRLLT